MPVPPCCSDTHFNNEILSTGEKKKKKKFSRGDCHFPHKRIRMLFCTLNATTVDQTQYLHMHKYSAKETHTQINHQADVV